MCGSIGLIVLSPVRDGVAMSLHAFCRSLVVCKDLLESCRGLPGPPVRLVIPVSTAMAFKCWLISVS